MYQPFPVVLLAESHHLSSCCSTVIDVKEYQRQNTILQVRNLCLWSDASVLFGKVQCKVLKGFKSGARGVIQFGRCSIKKNCQGASFVHSSLKINSVSWSSYCATVYSCLLPSFDLFLRRGCKYKEQGWNVGQLSVEQGRFYKKILNFTDSFVSVSSVRLGVQAVFYECHQFVFLCYNMQIFLEHKSLTTKRLFCKEFLTKNYSLSAKHLRNVNIFMHFIQLLCLAVL